jgi:hypothetical protein
MPDIIDLTDVYTYTGSVYLGNDETWGPFLRTMFSNGSVMYSRLFVRTSHKSVNGAYTTDIEKRNFSVHSTVGNGQPLQKYEVILTLLDQEGRESGPQYQTRLGSGHPSTDFYVDEPAVKRLRGDSGRLCYRVEIRSLEKKLANASDTDAEKKIASKPVPNSIHLEKPAKIIAKLLNNDDHYSDVVVACGEGLRMKAHKNILCAHSETFRRAFSQKSLVEGRNGVYTISEDHMRPEVVRLLLQWMYLAEVTASQADLVDLLEAAEYFQVQGCGSGAALCSLRGAGFSCSLCVLLEDYG